MKKKLILTLLTASICATTAIQTTSLAMENNIIEIETTGVNEEIKTNLENVKNSMKENINILEFLVKISGNSSLKDKTDLLITTCDRVLKILNDNLLNSVENYNKNTCEILQKIKKSFENFKEDIIDPKDLKSTVNDKIKEFSELVDQISLDSHVQEENAPLANEKKVNEDNKNEDNKNNNYKTDVVTNIYNDNDNGISPAPLLQGMNDETKTPQNSNNNNNNVKNENKIEEQINFQNMSRSQRNKILNAQRQRNKLRNKTQKLKTNNIKNENKIEELKANNINNENEIEELKANNIINENEIEELKANNINNENKIEELKANNINNENEIKEPKINNINNDNNKSVIIENYIKKEPEIVKNIIDDNKNIIIENYIENPKISKVNNYNTKKTTISKGNKKRKNKKKKEKKETKSNNINSDEIINEYEQKYIKTNKIKISTKNILNYLKQLSLINNNLGFYVYDRVVCESVGFLEYEIYNDKKGMEKLEELKDILTNMEKIYKDMSATEEFSNSNIKEAKEFFDETKSKIMQLMNSINLKNLPDEKNLELIKQIKQLYSAINDKTNDYIFDFINIITPIDNIEEFKEFRNNFKQIYMVYEELINPIFKKILPNFNYMKLNLSELLNELERTFYSFITINSAHNILEYLGYSYEKFSKFNDEEINEKFENIDNNINNINNINSDIIDGDIVYYTSLISNVAGKGSTNISNLKPNDLIFLLKILKEDVKNKKPIQTFLTFYKDFKESFRMLMNISEQIKERWSYLLEENK